MKTANAVRTEKMNGIFMMHFSDRIAGKTDGSIGFRWYRPGAGQIATAITLLGSGSSGAETLPIHTIQRVVWASGCRNTAAVQWLQLT